MARYIPTFTPFHFFTSMPRPLVHLIYNLLLPVALLLGLPSFLVKGVRRGGLARNFRQRLGFFRRETREALRRSDPVWVHAVSVGEVFLALKIIRALHELAPEQSVVLSTTTTTGHRVAREAAEEINRTRRKRSGPDEEGRELSELPASARLHVIHNPVDLPLVAGSVFRLLQPKALVLVEAEIWPNLVRAARRRDLPVILANARLSPRSESRYRRFRAFVAPVFSQVTLATVPFATDRARWSALGIPEDRIQVTGSVKFDESSTPDPGDKGGKLRGWLESTGFPEGGRILLGASTHEGEELLLARTWRRLREKCPALRLVLVPRHAERGRAIAAQLEAAGEEAVLRTGTKDLEKSGPSSGGGDSGRGDPVPASTDPGTLSSQPSVPSCWIAATTGELRAWYSLAEVVVVGKSFAAAGGQNPVEPLLAGCPVIVGPRMENFAEVVANLRLADGISQVEDEEALQAEAARLLADPEAAADLARRGREAMEKHRGATERTAGTIFQAIRP